MILKLGIFLLFTLVQSIRWDCPKRYFTFNEPCDTRATPLYMGEHTYSKLIYRGASEATEYYFLRLNGTEKKIEIEVSRYGGVDSGFFEIRSVYSSPSLSPMILSEKGYFNETEFVEYSFSFRADEFVKFFQISTVETREDQILFIGVNAPHPNVHEPSGIQIRCAFPKEDIPEPEQEGSFSWKAFFVISGAAVFVLTFGAYCFKKNPSQRLAQSDPPSGRDNPQNMEAQLPLLPNIQAPQSERLNQIELQEYFPRLPFGTLENPFQQLACPFCLEEFAPSTVCCQLYCRHIFHDYCAQAWLSKKNDCPACRGPVTREAIKEFLEAKALET